MPTPTPNMGLLQPIIGTDTGLTWEQSTNTNASTVDQHNHTSGQGVPIPPAGLNINSALPFNNQQATGVQAVVFQDQASLSTLNAMYTINGELWYNDPTQPVQITLGGTVNATSSGIASGTASASFVSSVLVVDSNTSTPANIQAGSILLGNNVANSKYLTLSPPSAMATNLAQTLPSTPVAQSFMTMDSSGNMGTPALYPLPGTSIASQTITQGLLALRATGSTVAAGGYAVSAAVASYSNSTSSISTIAGISIVTTGRPLVIALQPAGGTTDSSISVTGTGTTSLGRFRLFNTVTPLATFDIGTTTGSTGNCAVSLPPGSIFFIAPLAAGTYSISLGAFVNSTSFPGTVTATNVALTAYEL